MNKYASLTIFFVMILICFSILLILSSIHLEKRNKEIIELREELNTVDEKIKFYDKSVPTLKGDIEKSEKEILKFKEEIRTLQSHYKESEYYREGNRKGMEKYIELYEGALKEAEYWKNKAAKMNGISTKESNVMTTEINRINNQLSEKEKLLEEQDKKNINLYLSYRNYQSKVNNAYAGLNSDCQEQFRTVFG